MGCSVVRGIRGAITVEQNSAADILAAAKELLLTITEVNQVQVEDIASIIFSVTPDLDAAFPAKAARELGWTSVPLLDLQQMQVKGALQRCIRVLMHVNTKLRQTEIKHIYLREAKKLRPDLVEDNT
ncbi:MAG: chorismate mutase [Firmicutes bacterium]|nr:chorismate mutase [Bacillota bacterium]